MHSRFFQLIRNNRFFLLLLFVSLVSHPGLAAAERYYLDITSTDVRKVMVAVPDFQGSGGNGHEMAELLGRGLAFHGFIDIVDQAKYGGNTGADWKALGVDFVVMGKYAQAAGKLTVEGQLLDVSDNRMLGGRRFTGAPDQQDDMVLRLCDALIEEFTGTVGVSRSRLAFVSDASGKKEIYVSDVLGRAVRQVTKHRHLAVSPRFSPDGVTLAYSSYHTGNQNLYVTDLRQSKTTKVISRLRGMNLAPTFSPDGRSMVVTLSKDGSPDLYRMDLQGNVTKRLTSGAGINVSADFSPDGRQLVFVSDRSGRPQVYSMDVDGQSVRRLTTRGKENSEPSWSPSGDKIAYTSLVDGGYQVFVMDTQGDGSAKQLTNGPGECESPVWSPDGKMIAFSRRQGGRQELWVMQQDGKNARVLFKLPGNQSYPRWTKPVN